MRPPFRIRLFPPSPILFPAILTAAFWLFGVCPPAEAQTNYVFFSVNGDTSATAMVQGDLVAWGANCDVGGSIEWTLVYDVDSNGVLSLPGDVWLVTFVARDGDTSGGQNGLPDVNPIPDGWFVTPSLILGLAPGHYIFKAIGLIDSSSVQNSLSCTAMLSPPNSFSGRLVVPYHPAPDPAFLKYRWVQAEGKNGENQIWTALTNDSGAFTINIDSTGTGQLFRLGAPDLPGYVAPDAQMLMASGHITGVDFVYSVPVDSIWGYVEDEHGDTIMNPVTLYCFPTYGSGGKDATAQNGRYVFYFGLTELGPWGLSAQGDGLIPQYLIPERFNFDNSVQHYLHHDMTCPTSDTVMFARVWEAGGLPVHPYAIWAEYNSTGLGTRAVTGTGTNNVATLHIASLGSDHWAAAINPYDDHYPVPPGYFVGMNPGPFFGPGDTVDLVIERSFLVSDTIKSDPGDPPPNWGNIWVNFSGPIVSGPTLGSDGVYSLYSMSGGCSIGLWAPGYFVSPPSHDLTIERDTVGGLGFEINQAHCRIHGGLSGITPPLAGYAEVYAHADTAHPGYQILIPVDMFTGQFDLALCDGEWTLVPPVMANYQAPDSLTLIISNAPDTLRVVDFAYTPATGVTDRDIRPREFKLDQNYPNPFNPSTTIRYALPEQARVSLTVYDILGRRVRTLVDGIEPPGEHGTDWDGRTDAGQAAASGVYIYRLTAGSLATTRRMLLLR